jgi:hypothetical protein
MRCTVHAPYHAPYRGTSGASGELRIRGSPRSAVGAMIARGALGIQQQQACRPSAAQASLAREAHAYTYSTAPAYDTAARTESSSLAANGGSRRGTTRTAAFDCCCGTA